MPLLMKQGRPQGKGDQRRPPQIPLVPAGGLRPPGNSSRWNSLASPKGPSSSAIAPKFSAGISRKASHISSKASHISVAGRVSSMMHQRPHSPVVHPVIRQVDASGTLQTLPSKTPTGVGAVASVRRNPPPLLADATLSMSGHPSNLDSVGASTKAAIKAHKQRISFEGRPPRGEGAAGSRAASQAGAQAGSQAAASQAPSATEGKSRRKSRRLSALLPGRWGKPGKSADSERHGTELPSIRGLTKSVRMADLDAGMSEEGGSAMRRGFSRFHSTATNHGGTGLTSPSGMIYFKDYPEVTMVFSDVVGDPLGGLHGAEGLQALGRQTACTTCCERELQMQPKEPRVAHNAGYTDMSSRTEASKVLGMLHDYFTRLDHVSRFSFHISAARGRSCSSCGHEC